MECPSGRVVYDAELYAYICLDNGIVVEDRPITSDHPPKDDGKDGELLALVNTAVHDYGIGTDVSHLDYSEARSVTMHHILGIMVKKLGMPKYVQAESARIIRELMRKGITAGRRTEELIASVIYASAKSYGTPITIEQICKELGVDRRKVRRNYKTIIGTFRLKQERIPIHIYLVQAVSKANLEYSDYQGIIESILSRLPPDLKSRKPHVLAEAVILLAYLIRKGRLNQ